MTIISIGQPGAGKDTQADKLSSKLAIPRISAKQVVAHRGVTLPVHHLGLGTA